MNAVWNSYGQLCGCPEIFKKSCKFFCRELDIRVSQVMKPYLLHSCQFTMFFHLFPVRLPGHLKKPSIWGHLIVALHLLF